MVLDQPNQPPSLGGLRCLQRLRLAANAPLTALPPSLAAGARLKRVNLSKLQLDAASTALCEQIKATVLAAEEGIFWGCDGQRLHGPPAKK